MAKTRRRHGSTWGQKHAPALLVSLEHKYPSQTRCLGHWPRPLSHSTHRPHLVHHAPYTVLYPRFTRWCSTCLCRLLLHEQRRRLWGAMTDPAFRIAPGGAENPAGDLVCCCFAANEQDCINLCVRQRQFPDIGGILILETTGHLNGGIPRHSMELFGMI